MKNIVTNISIPWLVFTLLVLALLINLGLWQNDRALEKEQRLARIEQLSNKNALTLAQVLEQSPDEINDLPIRLNGEFVDEKQFLLDNQTNSGQLGYRVYQVLEVDDKAILVNLGWVLGSISRQELPDIKPIVGSYQLKGHVRLIEAGILLMEQKFNKNQWPLRVQQIELEKFSQVIDVQLLPFVVYLDKTDKVGYKKNWQPIVMPPEKHRAYAFQWFSLGVAWLMLMIGALIKFSKNENQA
ncbi:MAG: SURF1 family protein [Colwellia sp.]|nr:SURF1 family protein [Colwellia sp.]